MVGVHMSVGRYYGVLYDVSSGGAFLAVEPVPTAGSSVTIVIRFNDASELVLGAKVVHTQGDASGKLVAGVGVEFENPSEADAQRLQALVDKLRRGENPRE
jgi:hypothetical protein